MFDFIGDVAFAIFLSDKQLPQLFTIAVVSLLVSFIINFMIILVAFRIVSTNDAEVAVLLSVRDLN